LTINLAEDVNGVRTSLLVTGLPHVRDYVLADGPSLPETRSMPIHLRARSSGPSQSAVIVQAHSSPLVGMAVQDEIDDGHTVAEAFRRVAEVDGLSWHRRQVIYIGPQGVHATAGGRCMRFAEQAPAGHKRSTFVATGNMLTRPGEMQRLARVWTQHLDREPLRRLMAVMDVAVADHAELRRQTLSGFALRHTDDDGLQNIDVPFAPDGEVLGRLRELADADWETAVPDRPAQTEASKWFRLETAQYNLFRRGFHLESLRSLDNMVPLVGNEIPQILGSDVHASRAVRALTLGGIYLDEGRRALEHVMSNYGEHWGDVVARDLDTQDHPVPDAALDVVREFVPTTSELDIAPGHELLLGYPPRES
jgi:hypothetical protein